MSETKNDISFDDLKGRYDFFKFLPLDNVFFFLSIKTYNRGYTDEVCSNLSKGNNGNCDLHSLCLSLHDILQNLKELFKTNYSNTQIKWCEYLDYWIYDYIKNNAPCNEYAELYEKLKLLMSKYLSEYNCNIIYPTIDHDKLIKKKKISLYTDILYWIKNAYDNIFDTHGSKLYDQYFGECFRFYKEVMCNEDSYIKDRYKTQLQEFENNFNEAITFLKGKNISIPQVVLPLDEKLMCTLEWTNIKAKGEEQASEVRGDRGPLAGGLEEEETGEAQSEHGDLAPKGLVETGPQGREGPIGKEVSASPATEEAATLIDGEGALTEKNTMDVDINEDSPISITPNRIGTIGSTVAGSSLFLLMMYKVKKHI
ncbi:hypothetical protein PVMG_06164 [Plasmodium vivax Mauritania I]|uniref:Variable surface protein Vir24g n=1 Tax=Plasmodium vivax Mauritania I TaxID=1035515 RepID=A0A0J9T3X9_PLAVI|nr:hypothetical protein PVMG_06164 [Plasmodium vivax Mauritania I]